LSALDQRSRKGGARIRADGTLRSQHPADLPRTTLQFLFVGALIAGTFWVLQPFLAATLWAVAIVVATWPLFLRLEVLLWGSRRLAVAVMTVGLLLLLVVPLFFAIVSIVENADRVTEWSGLAANFTVPAPPAWVARLPVVGAKITAGWGRIAALSSDELSGHLVPYVGTVVGWFVARIGGLGMMLVHFLLTIVIAAILYGNGQAAADAVLQFARRLAGPQGEHVAELAAQAVRAVALGVVVTAVVDSGLGGIGLALAGVPFVAVLTALLFLSGVAQIGPTLVLVPAVFWVYWTQGSGWGTALLGWTIAVSLVDNLLRLMLIRKGANLPFLLIFAGVVGGLIAFGVIGLFVGPVLLAVAYTLLFAWMAENDRGSSG
jgi:predicted PurR-regulated permease PerM